MQSIISAICQTTKKLLSLVSSISCSICSCLCWGSSITIYIVRVCKAYSSDALELYT